MAMQAGGLRAGATGGSAHLAADTLKQTGRNVAARLCWRVFGLGQLRLLAALCLVPQVAVLARGAAVPHGGAELGPLHLAPRKAHHQCCGSHGHLPVSAVFVAG